MREQLSDREFLEYVRIGTGLGSRSVKSFERLRVLAGASVTVPVPYRTPDNNWNLLLDLAQSRLDLKAAEIIISDLCASAGLTRAGRCYEKETGERKCCLEHLRLSYWNIQTPTL